MKYKLATSTWDNKEIEAIHEVIESDMYSMGPKVKEFEKEFSNFFGSKYAVMCSSGSTANLIMVASLFFSKNPLLKFGDEILVPAVSWSTTYFPLQQYGLKLKFIDIDINTLNYNLHDLENAITEKTKAIMVVNLLGNNNDFEKIYSIISDKNITVIEDNCESMGAIYKGKYSGTFGLMGTFSSFFSHHISTMEGGVVVTDSEEFYHILLCLRAHGWTRNLPKINHVMNKSDNWFKESFKFVLPGYNVRPLEMSGAIGLEQLKKLPHFLEVRRSNALFFKKLFSSESRFIIQSEVFKSSWFGFSFIIKESSGINRQKFVNYLYEKGVEVRPIVTGNFVNNPALRYFDYTIHKSLKNAELLDKNGFFVGNSHENLEKEIVYLHEIIKNYNN